MPVGLAAIALAAPAVQAQQCACSNLVPSGQQINGCQMNEDGGPVTHLVGAGATAPTRHANKFFMPNVTVTHVCIGLAQPAAPQTAVIQFRSVDPFTGLPGGTFHSETFGIAPNAANFQIVQLTTPVTPSSDYWLAVEYTSASSGVLHQGTRLRTGPAGTAAVQIDGFAWQTYDSIGVTGYGPNAPIIRALNLGPAAQPQCPPHISQACCTIVCAQDPSCCVAGGWTPACDALAQTLCANCVACPPGATLENEPCGAVTFNEGCGFKSCQAFCGGSAPAGCWCDGSCCSFNDCCGDQMLYCNVCPQALDPTLVTPLHCNDTVCGSLWQDGALVDIDWYRIDVPPDPGGAAFAQVDILIESDIEIEVRLQNDECVGHPSHIIWNGMDIPACSATLFSSAVPAPGTYYLIVKPNMSPAGTPATCPDESLYTMDIHVSTCGAAACASCPPGGVQACGACASQSCLGCVFPGASFWPAQCGETYCGELYAVAGLPIDEHWYELDIPAVPGGFAQVILSIEAELPVQVEIQDDSCTNLNYNADQFPACQSMQIGAGVPAPGKVYIVIRPDVLSGHPCGTTNKYTMRVDIVDPTTGVNCPTASSCATCPPGSIASCGACASGQCSGCVNMDFETAQCGMVHCGELLADAGVIEENWYELNVPNTSAGLADVLLTLEADMDVFVVIYDDTCTGNVISSMVVSACTTASVIATVPTPIGMHISVRPMLAAGHPCGSANTYWMQVDVIDTATGAHCPGCPTPLNDECVGALPAVQGPNFTPFCGATASFPPDIHADCPAFGFGGPGSADADLWYEFHSTCVAGGNRLYEFHLVPHPIPPVERVLGIYGGCPFAGFGLLACGESFGGAPAILQHAMAPGDAIVLRASAPSGLGTTTSGDLLVDYAIPCIADIASQASYLAGCTPMPDPDCTVDVFDMLCLLWNWGPCPPAGPCPADIASLAGCGIPDGVVDVHDLLCMLSLWGHCP